MADRLLRSRVANLARDFRHIDPSSARVVLIEGESQVLATFGRLAHERDEAIAGPWRRDSHRSARNRSNGSGTEGGDEFIPVPCENLGGGNTASFVGKSLGVPVDRLAASSSRMI